jgi:ABC-type uncharacterized transport system YnjBCD ATPase subunit
MNTQATLADRQLHISLGGDGFLSIPLDTGGKYRLRLQNSGEADAVVLAIESIANIAVLTADGGVLNGFTVFENLQLAMHYGLPLSEREDRQWQSDAHLAMRLCGLDEDALRSFGNAICADLSDTHRWMVGLVRNILCPPDILVLDRTFAGLSRQHVDSRIAMQSVFHTFHPFRPALFVDVDSYELPLIPNCKAEFELGAEPCPC